MLEGLKEQLKQKAKKKVKKWLSGVLPPFVAIIGCAGAMTALIGLVIGIITVIFSPFTNKYQKEATYSQISSYGGAYKALQDGLFELEKTGVDYKTIYQAFSIEASSYDSAASTITIPNISVEDYENYATSANDGNKDVAGTQSTMEVNWNQSSFTYQYRTHWQYLLTIATVSKFSDDDAMTEQIDKVGENMDDDGVVQNPDKIGCSLVSYTDIQDAYRHLVDAGMETNVDFFTQYVSDDVYKWITNQGLGSTVNFVEDAMGGGQIGNLYYDYALSIAKKNLPLYNDYRYLAASGFPYSAYCYPAWHNGSTAENGVDRGRTDRYLYGTNVSSNMTYSSDSVSGARFYDRGKNKGDYSYVYYEGNVYPVCLVREASNWLCKWTDFEYVKVKDDEKNTHYELTNYKKTYRIGELIKVWETMGIDPSLYSFVFDIMTQIEGIVGGSTSSEFAKAYEVYTTTGEELTYQYKNPSYYQGTINEEDKEFTNSSAYAKVLNSATTSVNLEAELRDIYNEQDTNFVPSTRVGLRIASTMYEGKMSYQPPHYESDSSSVLKKYGFYGGLWSSSTKGADYYRPKMTPGATTVEGFGTFINSSDNAKNNDFGQSERIGLCASGFVNFILSESVFQQTRDASTNSPYTTASGVRMKEIYDRSDYKFTNANELVVGDIGLLSLDEGADALEDEKNNVIAYYAGIEGGKHVFYCCLSPDNVYSDYYGNDDISYVQKICLEDSAKYMKVELKYFCRYYYGFTRGTGNSDAYGHIEVIKEFSTSGSALNKQMFNMYSTISGMISKYTDNSFISNSATGEYKYCNISQRGEVLAYLNSASPYLYGDRTSEVYEHYIDGLLIGGTGGDGYCGIDFEDTKYMDSYTKLTTGVMTLPIHSSDGFTGYITSWYGWRDNPTSDIHERKFHNGMDLWTTYGDNTKVYGIDAGEVIDTGENNSCGKYIIIDYGNNIRSSYFHLSRVLVQPGDKVSNETIVGYMGTTGDSTGVHLHLELRDGEVHDGTDMYAHPEWGGRPDVSSCKETVDPYLFFPELDDWNLSWDLEGTRPDIPRD